MEHFVRVIFDHKEQVKQQLDESVFPRQNILETADGRPVFEIPLSRELSESESDEYADRLANYMFEQGYNDFDIEISTNDDFEDPQEGQLPFDVVEDMAIYMRNDPMFYRKSFFPVVNKLHHCHKHSKDFDHVTEFTNMIERAKKSYCQKFKINKRPEDLMDETEQNNLVQKLYAEEMTQIRRGVYDK